MSEYRIRDSTFAEWVYRFSLSYARWTTQRKPFHELTVEEKQKQADFWYAVSSYAAPMKRNPMIMSFIRSNSDERGDTQPWTEESLHRFLTDSIEQQEGKRFQTLAATLDLPIHHPMLQTHIRSSITTVGHVLRILAESILLTPVHREWIVFRRPLPVSSFRHQPAHVGSSTNQCAHTSMHLTSYIQLMYVQLLRLWNAATQTVVYTWRDSDTKQRFTQTIHVDLSLREWMHTQMFSAANLMLQHLVHDGNSESLEHKPSSLMREWSADSNATIMTFHPLASFGEWVNAVWPDVNIRDAMYASWRNHVTNTVAQLKRSLFMGSHIPNATERLNHTLEEFVRLMCTEEQEHSASNRWQHTCIFAVIRKLFVLQDGRQYNTLQMSIDETWSDEACELASEWMQPLLHREHSLEERTTKPRLLLNSMHGWCIETWLEQIKMHMCPIYWTTPVHVFWLKRDSSTTTAKNTTTSNTLHEIEKLFPWTNFQYPATQNMTDVIDRLQWPAACVGKLVDKKQSTELVDSKIPTFGDLMLQWMWYGLVASLESDAIWSWWRDVIVPRLTRMHSLFDDHPWWGRIHQWSTGEHLLLLSTMFVIWWRPHGVSIHDALHPFEYLQWYHDAESNVHTKWIDMVEQWWSHVHVWHPIVMSTTYMIMEWSLLRWLQDHQQTLRDTLHHWYSDTNWMNDHPHFNMAGIGGSILSCAAHRCMVDMWMAILQHVPVPAYTQQDEAVDSDEKHVDTNGHEPVSHDETHLPPQEEQKQQYEQKQQQYTWLMDVMMERPVHIIHAHSICREVNAYVPSTPVKMEDVSLTRQNAHPQQPQQQQTLKASNAVSTQMRPAEIYTAWRLHMQPRSSSRNDTSTACAFDPTPHIMEEQMDLNSVLMQQDKTTTFHDFSPLSTTKRSGIASAVRALREDNIQQERCVRLQHAVDEMWVQYCKLQLATPDPTQYMDAHHPTTTTQRPSRNKNSSKRTNTTTTTTTTMQH